MGMIYSPGVAGLTGQVQFNNSGIIGADNSLFWDNTNKRLGLNTVLPSAQLDISSYLATQIPLSIRGATNQTSNLSEWKSSNGTIVNSITSDGTFSNGYGSGGIKPANVLGHAFINYFGNPCGYILGDNSGNLAFLDTQGTTRLSVNLLGISTSSILINTSGATHRPSVILDSTTGSECGLFLPGGFGSNTLGIVTQRTTRMSFNSTGNVFIGGFTASTVGLTLRSASNPTSNILEWQNSTGVSKASVTKDFELQTTTGSGAPTTTPADGATYVDTTNHRFYVRSGGTWKYTNLI